MRFLLLISCLASLVRGQVFNDVDALLDALQDADEGLVNVRADIEFTKIFAIQGDIHRRSGTLWYQVLEPATEGKPAVRRFAVRFETLNVGNRVEREPMIWVYQNGWLLEVNEKEKFAIKRQVVAPGESFDPLQIGEGPFPVPIGQRKADILREYDAQLAESTDGVRFASLRKAVENLVQLHLTPKLDGPYEEVRIWYDRESLLPKMARTVNPEGDETYLRLTEIERNVEFENAPFDLRIEDRKDYDIDVVPWGRR